MTLVIILIILIVVVIILVTKLIDIITSSKAPVIATPRSALEQIRLLLDIKPSDEVWEIGCGDGRVTSYLAQKHPSSDFVGIENGIQMYILAWWRTRKQRNVKINFANLNKVPPETANKIYIYLLPNTISKYIKLIPVGARVVSLEYGIPGVKADMVVKLRNQERLAHKLYVYQF